ncbi:MAG: sulfotransferase domain-containing protein, partial [Rubrobacter sp.]
MSIGNEEPTREQRAARRGQKVARLREQLEEKDRELDRLRTRLVARPSDRADAIDPQNVIWMFGTGRSGSTWLSDMMGDLGNHAVWREPLVGALFGNLYYVRADHRRGEQGKHFILGRGYKETWMRPMREMILGGAAARFPEVLDGGYVVIKEPNGSIGAPLLMEALPESRMILLVRDHRDVVASSLDARKEGSWLYQRRDKSKVQTANENPDRFLKGRAENYLRDAGNSKEAYDAHKGPKVLVRYEDLRADTAGELGGVLRFMGQEPADAELADCVAFASVENMRKLEEKSAFWL